MTWRHIVIEAYCGGEEEHTYPCSRRIGVHCLSAGLCPWLGYCKSSEREAAYWAPLRLIVWDKLREKLANLWRKVRWWAWDKWGHEKRWAKIMSDITVVDDPETQEKRINKDFPAWLEKMLAEEMESE